MRFRKTKLAAWMVLILSILTGWALWGNSAVGVTEYEVTGDRIPEAFAGFRIAQISDLHNAEFGEENEKLVRLLSGTEPDIIVLTGDLIYSRQVDMEIALTFAGKAAEIAPVYYVSGNHEARIPEYKDLKKGLTEAGVTVLENQKVRIARGEEHITLMGIQDPSFREDTFSGNAVRISGQAIASLRDEADGFTVLLAHRPELFELYVESGLDLVFSGHAHGGQFRLPFIGGLMAPNQGFFPKYDAGQFAEENTTMIVSRGLGRSVIPIRINNPPEIVVAELKCS